MVWACVWVPEFQKNKVGTQNRMENTPEGDTYLYTIIPKNTRIKKLNIPPV